jgi:hypothetical protein
MLDTNINCRKKGIHIESKSLEYARRCQQTILKRLVIAQLYHFLKGKGGTEASHG